MSETITRVSELADQFRQFTGVDAVYGKPASVGNYTLITAAEFAGGFGIGGGEGGVTPPTEEKEQTIELGEEIIPEESPEEDQEPLTRQPGGSGAGVGGGMGGVSRPVAVIIVGEDDVWVEPIIDRTRMGIAVATTVAAMGVALIKAIGKSR